jgi:hypothetical protein
MVNGRILYKYEENAGDIAFFDAWHFKRLAWLDTALRAMFRRRLGSKRFLRERPEQRQATAPKGAATGNPVVILP